MSLLSLRTVLVLSATAAAVAAAACTDPVLDDQVDALGDEISSIPKGEYHRPGQDCALCHQEGGKASSAIFTVAGTVFASPNREVGVDSAEVRMTDSDGTKYIAKTNCVGNFFVRAGDWSPKFPILVSLYKGGIQRNMSSVIGRSSSCAHCHKLDVKKPFEEVGQLYLFSDDEPDFPNGDPTCPTSPIVPGTK